MEAEISNSHTERAVVLRSSAAAENRMGRTTHYAATSCHPSCTDDVTNSAGYEGCEANQQNQLLQILKFLGLSDVISLRIRTGTQNGVRTHTLRVETHADLAQWVRAIVLGTYEACSETSQVSSSFRCVPAGRESKRGGGVEAVASYKKDL